MSRRRGLAFVRVVVVIAGIVAAVVVAVPSGGGASSAPAKPLLIDTARFGQTFDGIGALSGGGATSRLLVDYLEPQKSQILDYLFKPSYGASLQIIKVEIGGDSQSTDGTEPSHMHTRDDLDYERGYEWWLLKEAKKRNPGIKTYGLPWTFPGWVGGPEQSGDPFKHPELTSEYILKWLQGARSHHGVEIDYIGIWNERASDGTYARTLRKTLDEAGFGNTTLVAKDGGTSICNEMAKEPGYSDAIGVVGLHYPSDFQSMDKCHSLGYGLNGKRGGKPIWSSEESSSYDDLNGAACWARVMASHWVLEGITSSIMWNLVGSYFHGTNWYASSLLTASEPWSGHYDSMTPLWATAHVTQFTEIGWDMLEVGGGSGQLPQGGFYVTYSNPPTGDWTLNIVKIGEDHAPCVRPHLPHFTTSAENVTFQLAPPILKRSQLAVWYSNFEEFHPDGTVPHVFTRLPDIDATNGSFSLEVKVGAYYTISTIVKGPKKGGPPTPVPTAQPVVPLPFADDFEKYPDGQEGRWWSDQIGVFEVHNSSVSKDRMTPRVMRQMVPETPIGWQDHGSRGPVSVLGMLEWQDLTVSAEFALPSETPNEQGVCVGTRVDQMWANGVVLCILKSGRYFLSSGGPWLGGKPSGRVYASGTAASGPLIPGSFSSISLTTIDDKASSTFDGVELFKDVRIRTSDTGFAAIGATSWLAVEFNSTGIDRAGTRWEKPVPAPSVDCGFAKVGGHVFARHCATNGLAAEDQEFDLLASWGIRHRPSGLCVSAALGLTKGAELVLAKCDPSDSRQLFPNRYAEIRNNVESIHVKASGGLLVLSGDLDGRVFLDEVVGVAVRSWKKWSFFPNTRQLRNTYGTNTSLGYPMCLSTCKFSTSDDLHVYLM